MMKPFLMLVCLLLVVGSPFARQDDKAQQSSASSPQSGQVEVNKDRFSGDVTVKLKPQMILDKPDQFIKMSMEAKFPGKRPDPDEVVARTVEALQESAMISFESQAKIVTDFGDQELHFLTDGKPLNKGKASGGVLTLGGRDPDLKPEYKIREVFHSSLSTKEMYQIARSNRVEIRLGKYEFTLTPAALDNFRDFVREFAKHAPSGKLKGKRP